MLVSHNVKRSGNKAWRQERFVACEVWSRRLLLTADYRSIMQEKLTLQRDGIPIVSLTMYVPLETFPLETLQCLSSSLMRRSIENTPQEKTEKVD